MPTPRTRPELPRPPASWTSDRGESLVEILVALTILAIAGVAILAGLQLSVKTSDIHRKQTTGNAYSRDYAEAIQDYVASAASHYVPCAGANAYSPATVGFALPAGNTASQSAAQAVLPGGGVAATCGGNDTGVQQIAITVTSNDNRASETVTVLLRKPCDATMAVCP